ncbi:MAG: hypothetical protein ACFCVA_07350 [Gammaproteobacteria bacterium]
METLLMLVIKAMLHAGEHVKAISPKYPSESCQALYDELARLIEARPKFIVPLMLIAIRSAAEFQGIDFQRLQAR